MNFHAVLGWFMLVKAGLDGSYAVYKQRNNKKKKKTLIDWILIACYFSLECILFLRFLLVVNQYGFDSRCQSRVADGCNKANIQYDIIFNLKVTNNTCCNEMYIFFAQYLNKL